MSIGSLIASAASAASIAFALPCEAQAQTKYYARQMLPRPAVSGSGQSADPTFSCAIPMEGYVAAYSGGLSPAFSASSPADAQAKCNASKPPVTNAVLNLCVYSTSASMYGPGTNAMAIWQDPSQTDHSQKYSAVSKQLYSSVCVRS